MPEEPLSFRGEMKKPSKAMDGTEEDCDDQCHNVSLVDLNLGGPSSRKAGDPGAIP